ncbi:NAD(P)-binding protein-34 [Coleophoma cylindrospora]|uniref:NAD(P)-binding protein-34 n=1 Tax=Coleophoma cylindrospora TaxID=1849047 RepID=A0A3D8RUR7_9HELO|nr:NAD(P)-binding protein-34 [Coleophoma cylindrospora]
MKAICVTESRSVELREVPSPTAPPSGYINVRIDAAAINHGDKTFLKLLPGLKGGELLENTWGASAAGTVTQVGADVPSTYLGRKVAIYRGLKPDQPVLGLWCETAQVSCDACLLLPDHVEAKDYSGSLVNVVAAYAFLEQAATEGHRGVIVTAGNSSTGRALVVLAQRRQMPILVIVRSEKAREEVLKSGVEVGHVLSSSHPDFLRDLEQKAQELGTTAVFDGIGGALISKILGALPRQSSIFFYGFLSGAEKVEFPSAIFMMKEYTMRMFKNSETVTVKEKLRDMLKDLEGCIDHPLFRTSLGREFQPEEIGAAMEYEGLNTKAVLVFP